MTITANGGLRLAPLPPLIPDEQYALPEAQGWRYLAFQDSLFPRSTFRGYSVSIHDIVQGPIGNCFFAAALLSIVEHQRGAQYIHDMMCDHGDGTVTVRLFHQAAPQYLRLRKSKIYRHDQRHKANWVYILEKALAIYRMQFGGECYIETKEDEDNRTIYNKRITYPPRKPNNLIEALTGGSSDEVFACFFKSTQTSYPSQCEAIQGDLVLETNRYVHSFNEIIYIGEEQTFADMSIPEITALETVFGSYSNPVSQALIDDFLSHNTTLSRYNLNKCGFEKQVFRFEDIKLFLEHNFPPGTLQDNTKAHLIAYALQYFPRKRGTGIYIDSQQRLFNYIADKLRKQQLVCLGTGLYLGRRNREHNPLATSETIVKGLVGPHAYQILGCYRRGPVNLFLVRNPWRQYGRTYVYKQKQKILEFHDPHNSESSKINFSYEQQVLSAIPVRQPASYLQRILYRYPAVPLVPNVIVGMEPQLDLARLLHEPGVFEIELSDVTKRFRNIYSVIPNWDIV